MSRCVTLVDEEMLWRSETSLALAWAMTTDGLDISMGWRMFRKYVLDPLRRLFGA